MTKSNSCICLLPVSPIFNYDTVNVFESMAKEDSSLLGSILYENYLVVLNEISDFTNLVFCIDKNDEKYLPGELRDQLQEVYSIDSTNINKEIKNINDKYFKKFHNNLLIFSHSIGVSSADIKKIFSLLEIEDESLLIGRDNGERIVLMGFNSYNEELFGNINEDRFHYNQMLIKASKHENFVHTLSNFVLMENIEDFKKLYDELSKKESLQYCNQTIHEKFTHLFIEYKELLK
jgi:hypothetical protein